MYIRFLDWYYILLCPLNNSSLKKTKKKEKKEKALRKLYVLLYIHTIRVYNIV